jgi:hypothetical protein
MTVYHDIQAAVPPTGSGPVDKTLLRDTIQLRAPYVLASSESAGDLIAVDPVTGAAINHILYRGRVFAYDDTDHTTDDDGLTCLVTSDGRRYKLADIAEVPAYSVLTRSLNAPPGSPAIGDAYLIAAAATGAWAGHSNEVSVWTARGWEFVDFGVGRLIYVEDIDAYYHRNAGGAWISGFGNLVIGANSVPLSAAINFGRRVIVENMTTNAPPGTAAVGEAYIIGPSPTGAWAGSALKIAICEVANTFTIYNPGNGWLAFNKGDSTEYRYNGSAWISAAGTWIDRKSTAFTVSGSTTAPTGATFYVNSSGTAPTTSQRRIIDNVTLAFAAKKTGAVLRFHYRASYSIVNGATGGAAIDLKPSCALFRDAGSSAIDWSKASNVEGTVDVWFEVTAPDTSSHTYTFAVMSGYDVGGGLGSQDYNSLVRRQFTVEEAA